MKTLKIETLGKTSPKGFNLLAGINRAIKPGHVTLLADSIEKMGIIRPVVIAEISFITGILLKYIIDGQHLYHACIRLNLDIPYIYIDITDELDMIEKLALLNSSSKSWTMKDYLQVWAYKHEDYVKLNNHHNTYDIELLQLAEILMEHRSTHHNNGGNSNITSSIKNGKFKIKDEQKGIKLLDYITDALKIVPRVDRRSNKFFISMFVNLVSDRFTYYDHKSTMENLKLKKDKFLLATQDENNFKALINSIIA